MRRMVGVVSVFAVAALAVAAASCAERVIEPLKLEGNLLTVDNRSRQAWTNVEIWLNYYYRVQTKEIPAGGRFQAPLDVFVEGYGRRFDWHRAQVWEVRLKAKLPDGKPLELMMPFKPGGLAGTLGAAVGGGKH